MPRKVRWHDQTQFWGVKLKEKKRKSMAFCGFPQIVRCCLMWGDTIREVCNKHKWCLHIFAWLDTWVQEQDDILSGGSVVDCRWCALRLIGVVHAMLTNYSDEPALACSVWIDVLSIVKHNGHVMCRSGLNVKVCHRHIKSIIKNVSLLKYIAFADLRWTRIFLRKHVECSWS